MTSIIEGKITILKKLLGERLLKTLRTGVV